MTRAEWIQQAMLRSIYSTGSREDTIAAIVKTADVLGKTVSWDPDPDRSHDDNTHNLEMIAKCERIVQLEREVQSLNGDVQKFHASWMSDSAKYEREACAKICEVLADKMDDPSGAWTFDRDRYYNGWNHACAEIERLIRDRGTT